MGNVWSSPSVFAHIGKPRIFAQTDSGNWIHRGWVT